MVESEASSSANASGSSSVWCTGVSRAVIEANVDVTVAIAWDDAEMQAAGRDLHLEEDLGSRRRGCLLYRLCGVSGGWSRRVFPRRPHHPCTNSLARGRSGGIRPGSCALRVFPAAVIVW